VSERERETERGEREEWRKRERERGREMKEGRDVRLKMNPEDLDYKWRYHDRDDDDRWIKTNPGAGVYFSAEHTGSSGSIPNNKRWMDRWTS
jgi:hypothetical protein